jgi:general secretion pathway protein K
MNIHSPFKILRQQTGAALMMALFSVMMLMIIATEIMYQTTVEAKVSAQAVNQVKAYYAAKAGVKLALFRIYLYRAAIAGIGESLPDKSALDMIWTFPFAWPPDAPDSIGMATKDQIQKSVKSSLMQSSYTMNIESEGSKIDINDLASPSEALAKATHQQILQIFESEMENNEDFANAHRNEDFGKLVNAMKDWIDEDKEGTGGGDERGPYSQLNNEDIPPNQAFKTVGELHMVDGMTDEYFDLLAPRITVFGTKGINVNHASKEVLQSIDRQINAERADKIVSARNDPDRGPFKDVGDFVGFLQTLGVDTASITDDGKTAKIPLIFDAEFNFRVKAVGKSGPVLREVVAITYDVDAVQSRLADSIKPSPTPTPTTTTATNPTPTPKPTPKNSMPKGEPNVVYWGEN